MAFKIINCLMFWSLFSEAHRYYYSVKPAKHLRYLFKNVCMGKILLILVCCNVQCNTYFHHEEGALFKREIY